MFGSKTNLVLPLIIAFLILLLSWFGRGLQLWMSSIVGLDNLIYPVAVFFCVLAYLGNKFLVINVRGLLLSLLLLFILFISLKPDVTEYVHLGEYASFALSLTFIFNRQKNGLLKCFIIALGLGCFDEILQWINPTRIFDLRDIALNAFGALIGLLSFKRRE